MIRIPINLASEPFRKTRAALVGYVSLAALLGVLLIVQTVYVVRQRNEAADLRTAKNQLTAQLALLDQQQGQVNATLRRPENSAVLEQSVFLNALIERKAISWTKLFADLEKTVPYNVRVMTLHPTVDSRNQVMLDMTVGAEKPEALDSLLKALEGSPIFGPVYQHSTLAPSQSEPLFRSRITVPYEQKL